MSIFILKPVNFNTRLLKYLHYQKIGPKVVPSSSSNKRSSAENEVVPVNSQPANVPQKNSSCADIRASFTHHHNHNDIVHFVGSGELSLELIVYAYQYF